MCAGLWEGVWASGDAHLCPVHGKYLNMGLGLSDADTNKLSIYSWNLCSWACVVQTYTGRLLPGVINLWVRQTAEVLGVHLVGTIRVSCAGSLLVLSHTYCHTFFLPLLELHCFLSAYALQSRNSSPLKAQKFLEMVCGWNSSFVCLAVWIAEQLQIGCRKDFDPTAPCVGPAAVLEWTWMSSVPHLSLWQSVLRGLPDWSRMSFSVSLFLLLFTLALDFCVVRRNSYWKADSVTTEARLVWCLLFFFH